MAKRLSKRRSFSGSGNGSFPTTENQGDVARLLAHLIPAYNLARYLMRNQAEAEDAVQSAYERAIRRFATLREDDGRAWFLTIVRNCCYDRLRRLGMSCRDLDFDEELYRTSAPDPETSLLKAERNELIRRSLEELPVASREILILREFEQLSYSEIGEVAGIPVGTVMSRLSRARERLQEKLSAYLGSAGPYLSDSAARQVGTAAKR